MTHEELVAKITKDAEVGEPLATDNEDFNAMDWSGGNYDDAFDMGEREGRIRHARSLLSLVERA